MKRLSTLLVLGLLLAQVRGAVAGPRYQFRFDTPALKNDQRAIDVVEDKERTTLIVTSLYGSGGATISLASGQWPSNIALRFQYKADKGFRYLEFCEITTAYLMAEATQDTSGQAEFWLRDASGKFQRGEDAAGTLNIKIEKREDSMEVLLPAHLFNGSKEVHLRWIDHWRD
jgi:hypothetical protein